MLSLLMSRAFFLTVISPHFACKRPFFTASCTACRETLNFFAASVIVYVFFLVGMMICRSHTNDRARDYQGISTDNARGNNLAVNFQRS